MDALSNVEPNITLAPALEESPEEGKGAGALEELP
jgi:hypothetical protein